MLRANSRASLEQYVVADQPKGLLHRRRQRLRERASTTQRTGGPEGEHRQVDVPWDADLEPEPAVWPVVVGRPGLDLLIARQRLLSCGDDA